jgi:MtaA/CmuA family methyltransferase
MEDSLAALSATPRAEILSLLAGRPLPRTPCFSGLISVVTPGLELMNVSFAAVHTDAELMARAAAMSARLFGLESAVVPHDLCLIAEALGATIDFRADEPIPMFPIVSQYAGAAPGDLTLPGPEEITTLGRIPLVLEAIQRLRELVGEDVAIGAFLPGPMTLALYLMDQMGLMASLIEEPRALGDYLDRFVDLLVEVGTAFRNAGADFLTIHEMGGSPGYLGPRIFETVLLSRLRRLIAALPEPRVLSICGNTNNVMHLLASVGAEAIHVDQLNDLARSREILGSGVRLFGNIDPVAVLANGSEEDVRHAVRAAVDAGVDAVWPGCDMWPEVPAANLQALVSETRRPRA